MKAGVSEDKPEEAELEKKNVKEAGGRAGDNGRKGKRAEESTIVTYIKTKMSTYGS